MVKKLSSGQIQKLERLARIGEPASRIAKKYGVAYETVLYHLLKAKIPTSIVPHNRGIPVFFDCAYCGTPNVTIPAFNRPNKTCSRSCRGKLMTKLKREKYLEYCKKGRKGLNVRDTDIERKIQEELARREIACYRNSLVVNAYPDFSFPDRKLVVFADGDYWHSLRHMMERDNRINRELQANGWKVLRFTGSQIKHDVSQVVDKIEELLRVSAGEE